MRSLLIDCAPLLAFLSGCATHEHARYVKLYDEADAETTGWGGAGRSSGRGGTGATTEDGGLLDGDVVVTGSGGTSGIVKFERVSDNKDGLPSQLALAPGDLLFVYQNAMTSPITVAGKDIPFAVPSFLFQNFDRDLARSEVHLYSKVGDTQGITLMDDGVVVDEQSNAYLPSGPEHLRVLLKQDTTGKFTNVLSWTNEARPYGPVLLDIDDTLLQPLETSTGSHFRILGRDNFEDRGELQPILPSINAVGGRLMVPNRRGQAAVLYPYSKDDPSTVSGTLQMIDTRAKTLSWRKALPIGDGDGSLKAGVTNAEKAVALVMKDKVILVGAFAGHITFADDEMDAAEGRNVFAIAYGLDGTYLWKQQYAPINEKVDLSDAYSDLTLRALPVDDHSFVIVSYDTTRSEICTTPDSIYPVTDIRRFDASDGKQLGRVLLGDEPTQAAPCPPGFYLYDAVVNAHGEVFMTGHTGNAAFQNMPARSSVIIKVRP